MRNYFRPTPDPDRGYRAGRPHAMDCRCHFPLRRVLGEIGESRFDPELFRMSRDDVGDTAETRGADLADGDAHGRCAAPVGEIVARAVEGGRGGHARSCSRNGSTGSMPPGRWALLKFLSGAPRVGVSARLAKQAVADAFGKHVDDDRGTLARARATLYAALRLAGAEGGGPPMSLMPVFRPLMLAHALEDEEWQAMRSMTSACREWKWDGIRIQVVGRGRRDAALLAHAATTSARAFLIWSRSLPFRCRARRRIAGDARRRRWRPSPTCSSG